LRHNHYKNNFRDSKLLTTWVRYFLFLQVIVAIASMILGHLEYQILMDYQNGVFTSQAEALAAIEVSDQRQFVMAITYLVVFVVSGFFILRWIHRANYNARYFVGGMEFTPAGSIGWYFVPIFTLWKPYLAMKEIWKVSYFTEDWLNAKASSLLAWWWFLWLTNGFLGQIVFRLSMHTENINDLMVVNRVYLASDLASLPLVLVTLMLVNNIYKAQMYHINRKEPAV